VSRLDAALLDETARSKCRDECDRGVDQQCPTPRGVLGQDASEHETDRRATTRDGAIHPKRTGAFVGLGEGHGEQRECGGCHHRGEAALECASAKEHG